MHGFAYALNALYPNFVGQNGVPRVIINRALLSITDEHQLDELVHTVPFAYAFCINGAFFGKRDHHELYLINYELGPGINGEKNFVSKCIVLNKEQHHQYHEKNGELNTISNKNSTLMSCLHFVDTVSLAINYLNHFNHYDRSNGLVVEREPLLWSRNRARRALEIGEIHTVRDALYLLGDRADETYPIFFIGGTTEINLATLCTAHFNFHTRQLIIYRNNPKECKEPQLIYNLDDLLLSKSAS